LMSRVHSGGSLMFRLMMVQELLNIEHFVKENSTKSN
jgi:hypothetical protein